MADAVLWLPHEIPVYVSTEDLTLLQQYTWWLHRSDRNGHSYAYTLKPFWCPVLNIRRRRKIYMHRLITNCPNTLVVDHRDRKTLNNQRSNLRVTSYALNNCNRYLDDNFLGYRGVSKHNKKYRARLQYEGDRVHIGYFDTLLEAAQAYDQKALEIFGEFALLNFDESSPYHTSTLSEINNIPF